MTDIPIIFSVPMILALLDGRKGQTRRLAWRPGPIQKPSPWQRVKPSDRLWVREMWVPHATGTDYAADIHEASLTQAGPWRSPIHMGRSKSRITLIVTATKIERLQDISEADAEAEGIIEDDGSEPDIWYVPGSGGVIRMEPLTANRPSKVFATLWRALHGPDSWDANHEVVALTFRVIKANIDAAEATAA